MVFDARNRFSFTDTYDEYGTASNLSAGAISSSSARRDGSSRLYARTLFASFTHACFAHDSNPHVSGHFVSRTSARFGTASHLSARALSAFFTLLFCVLCLQFFCVSWAWADTDTDAFCVLTDEARAQYEADGTLDERIAYMEQLQNDGSTEGLIKEAQERASGISLTGSHVPPRWASGMGSTGDAYILGVVVEFPAEGSEAATKFDDAQKQAQNFVASVEGGTGYDAPYESLQAYYQRSSYGKLTIGCRGTCYVVTAQHCRSYYNNNRIALFSEIAATLHDEQGVDFTQFDGNNDGYVDGMYIVFAGETTGWGSTWWPSESGQDTDIVYDGKRVRNTVFIDAIASARKVQTIIHETGHVLGLDDYYCYTNDTKGIDTVDMMNNDTGDHNAFSKWLLGWIDDSQIIRVAVTESGIKVRRGLEDVQVYTGSVSETIEAFTSDTMTEGGYFIAVSNDESILSGTLFSSFYLLQYDQPAGNQKYSSEDGLKAGLRVYRMQASLNADGTNFEKSNSRATYQHDMLIEALKPSDGGAVAETGDAFHTGASIGASTTPSTNFREDTTGYTGIHIDVTNADDPTSGTVTFSRDEQPPTPTFTLTPNFTTGILDNTTLSFTLSNAVDQAQSYPGAKLVVDGKDYSVYSQLKDLKLTCVASLPTGTIKENSTCEIVFPEGFFTIFGKAVPEIRIALTPRTPIADLSEKGTYSATSYQSYGSSAIVSNATTVAGRKILAEVAPTDMTKMELSLLTLNDDGSNCEIRTVPGVTIDSVGVSKLESFVLNNGQLLVHVLGTAYTQKAFEMLYWIDPETGSLLKSEDISIQGLSCVVPLTDGVAITSPKEHAGSTRLTMWLHEDGTQGYMSLRGMGVVSTGDNRLATLVYNQGFAGQVNIYSAEQLAKLSAGTPYEEVVPDAQLEVPASDCIEDVQVSGGVMYVLTRTTVDGASTLAAHRFNEQGELLGTVNIANSSANSDTASKLYIGDNGAVAIDTTALASNKLDSNVKEIAVVGADGNFVGFTSSLHNDAIYWAGGRFYLSDRSFDDDTGMGVVNWSRTAVIDEAKKPEPGPTPEPSPEPDPSPDPDSGSTSGESGDANEAGVKSSELAQTGDTLGGMTGVAGAMVLVSLASLLIASCVSRRSRAHR